MNGPVENTVIVDLRISFWRLMMFFIKAALAAIPAAIVVALIVMLVSAVIAALLGGNMDLMMRRWSL
jgi:hypothetical protein